MPVVNYEQYLNMMKAAYDNHYAYPAVNVSSMETANAVLKGLADAKSDGIVQVSVGGAEFASGLNVKDKVLGAISLADHVRLMAEKYNVYVALHTDHCTKGKLESFMLPLIAETEKRRAEGRPNLFNSHMFDGSDISLDENIAVAKELFARCAASDIVLEVETGVVGGEEDGQNNEGVSNDKLYTTPEDMLKVYDALKDIKGTYTVAATFGNVHGVYKPGNVKLNPVILKNGQDALKAKYGDDKGFFLVFHGGSGSSKEEIKETLGYGVIKMNIDTDTQYAFSKPVVDHMFKNYDGMLKIEGEVGNKKMYDPRAYLKKGEEGMAARVVEACNDLESAGKTIFG